MLISWDFSCYNESGEMSETKTSRQLQEEVFYPVHMHQRIEQNGSDFVRNLFVPDRSSERSPQTSFKFDSTDPTASTDVQEFTSTLFSLNVNGFGFIRDEGQNNIFFHYSTVTNKEFTELQAGMKVKYQLEEDPERSQREGERRFRACRVTVLD
jgi:cold shock CspA family protein